MEFFLRTLPEQIQGDKFSQGLARSWRISQSLQILDSLPGLPNDKYIATAHHMEDQLETILMKLLRGAHITNFHGVSYSSFLHYFLFVYLFVITLLLFHASKMKMKNGKFIRPILNFQKHELVDYLQLRNLTWMEDTSNAQRDYTRNKVRLDLIPLMSSLAGSPLALQKRLQTLAQQSAFVKEQVDEAAGDIAQSLKSISYRDQHVLFYANNSEDETRSSSSSVLDTFAAMPPLALETVLFEWILAKTGIRIDHSKMAEFLGLIRRPLRPGQLAASITISHKWDLVHSMNEVRLVLRGPAAGGVSVKSLSSWTSSVFGIDSATPEQLPVMVEVVHPVSVTIATDLLDTEQKASMANDQDASPEPKTTEVSDEVKKENETPIGGDNDHLLSHIRESPWVCKFDFLVPVPEMKQTTDKKNNENAETVLLTNQDEDAMTEGLVYTIRPADIDDTIYNDNLGEKFKVGTLVHRLRAERPNLGISRDRVLVVTTSVPVKKSNKKSKKLEAQRDDDFHLFETSKQIIVAVLIPGAVIYSKEYSSYLDQPNFAVRSVAMQVQVHGSPELHTEN